MGAHLAVNGPSFVAMGNCVPGKNSEPIVEHQHAIASGKRKASRQRFASDKMCLEFVTGYRNAYSRKLTTSASGPMVDLSWCLSKYHPVRYPPIPRVSAWK